MCLDYVASVDHKGIPRRDSATNDSNHHQANRSRVRQMKATDGKTRQFRTVSAGLLLTVIVLVAHYYLPNQASKLTSETIQSLHGPGFGVVALIIMMFVRGDDRTTVAYIKAAAFSMTLAVLAEAAQIPGPREAQISDILVDALGILGFLGTAAVFNREIRSTIGNRGAIPLALISVSALVLTMIPLLWHSFALVMRSQNTPQILSFDAVWERTYSSGIDTRPEIFAAPAGWPKGSGNIARLRSAGRYGLMLRIQPHPDWSEYSAMSFLAASTNEESMRIAIGIWGISPSDGSPPGRYYTTKKIGPVPARHCISFDDLDKPSSQRKFDLTNVFELLVGATSPETGIEILVDDFRLESVGCAYINRPSFLPDKKVGANPDNN